MVHIVGGGLSGSAAALAALQTGEQVRLWEKSRLPRHKVCGEYLTPEIAPLLQKLGVWEAFLRQRPATMRRLALHFPTSEKHCLLAEQAFGLSRYRLDAMLLERAAQQGAQCISEPAPATVASPTIVASGRREPSSRGNRIFGFKAHFDGPANDTIELFFFDGCYVGVSAVEDGITNVCGLGPESVLRRFDFDIDALTQSSPPLSARLAPLQRSWKWMTVGPLVFRNHFRAVPTAHVYPAGDALSFVDPFTGSGMLSAFTSGRLAGIAAARRTPVEQYLAECRHLLERPFQFASLFRSLLLNGWGEKMASFVPGRLLIHLTRPSRLVD